MTPSKDMIRQASLYTMGGLIDPRLMQGYESPNTKPGAKSFNFLNVLRKTLEGFTGGKVSNEPAQG